MIRRANPADAAAVAGLEAVGAHRPWSEASVRALLGAAHGCGWVVEWEGEVVAHLLGQQVVDEAEVHTVVVHPAQRRRGLGRRLVDHVLSAWQESGVVAVHLEVRDDNAPAIGLYLREGFAEVGRRPRYYGDVDARLMCWRPS